MAFSDHIATQWQRVKIVTCDPSTRRIEGQLKDRAVIQIALWEIPSGFRWPRPGEFWTVERRNSYWFLGQPMEIGETNKPVEELEPGDTKIGGGSDVRVYVDGILINVDGQLYFSLPEDPPSITGSRGGNAALASLLTALDDLGLVSNDTTA